MEASGFRVTTTNLADNVLDEIRRQLAAGDKITAIKTLRAATGLDLTAAKSAVEAIESGAAARSDKFELTGEAGERIRAALQAGKKADAIRLFREATGADLKTSHSAIEAFAQHLGAPSSTTSVTIPLGSSTISRAGGHIVQTIVALAALALLGFMLVKYTF